MIGTGSPTAADRCPAAAAEPAGAGGRTLLPSGPPAGLSWGAVRVIRAVARLRTSAGRSAGDQFGSSGPSLGWGAVRVIRAVARLGSSAGHPGRRSAGEQCGFQVGPTTLVRPLETRSRRSYTEARAAW